MLESVRPALPTVFITDWDYIFGSFAIGAGVVYASMISPLWAAVFAVCMGWRFLRWWCEIDEMEPYQFLSAFGWPFLVGVSAGLWGIRVGVVGLVAIYVMYYHEPPESDFDELEGTD